MQFKTINKKLIQRLPEYSNIPARESLTIISGAISLINMRPDILTNEDIYTTLENETNYFDSEKSSFFFRHIVGFHVINTRILHNNLYRLLCDRMDEADLETIDFLHIEYFSIEPAFYECRFHIEFFTGINDKSTFKATIKTSKDFQKCHFVQSKTDIKIMSSAQTTSNIPTFQHNAPVQPTMPRRKHRKRFYCEIM